MNTSTLTQINTQSVAVVGLGKLGLVWALILAKSGFRVHGVDTNKAVIEKLNNGILPISEPGLQDLYFESKTNFYPHLSISDVTSDATTIFIVVPTPSLSDATFDSSYVRQALQEIIAWITSVEIKHAISIVVTSTVMPNTCDDLNSYIHSHQKNTSNISLIYNPEFIALGSVISDMMKPDFILMGSNDAEAIERLSKIYKRVNGESVVIKPMSFTSAEITKISINTFLTLKISYANTIGILTECVPNADASAISDAVGSDTRIGHKYLKPGLGFGGPCLPRDTRAFSKLLELCGMPSDLSDASASVNSLIVHSKLNQIQAAIGKPDPSKRIVVLGIAYKNGSWLLEDSHQYRLFRAIYDCYPNASTIFDYCADDIKLYASEFDDYDGQITLTQDLDGILDELKPQLFIQLNPLSKTDTARLKTYINLSGASLINLSEPIDNKKIQNATYKTVKRSTSGTLKSIHTLDSAIFKELSDWYCNIFDCQLESCHLQNNSLHKLDKSTDQSTHFHAMIHQAYDNNTQDFKKIYEKVIAHVINSYKITPTALDSERIAVQSFPSLRIQFPGNISVYEYHKDSTYSHPVDEINTFISLTNSFDSSSLNIQQSFEGQFESFSRFRPLILQKGQYARLNTATTWHGDNPNLTDMTRVSIDFRMLTDFKSLNGLISHSGKRTMNIGSYYMPYNINTSTFD